MRLKTITAFGCALACAGLIAFGGAPSAQAKDQAHDKDTQVKDTQFSSQNRKKRVTTTPRRPRTTVTIRQRSYLDPGPQVPPGSRNDTNYLFLNRSAYDAMGPGQSFDRQPLTAPWEAGGSWRIP
ncbi:MAG: hypothetical protein AB7V13_22310 [Pseudorhodoplanes sp.]